METEESILSNVSCPEMLSLITDIKLLAAFLSNKVDFILIELADINII